MSEPTERPIVVIGSVNLDIMVQVDKPPSPGETVLSRAVARRPGGKGANQAVAASRMGASVSFIGNIGDDENGEFLLQELQSEGVDTSFVGISREPTGMAFILVSEAGENFITVISGANHDMKGPSVIASLRSHLASAVVVMQGEIPLEIIASVAAASVGQRVIINMAPFQPLDEATLSLCDPLILNQSEASSMLGFDVQSPEDGFRAVEGLLQMVRSCVVTLGGHGACWADGSDVGHVAAPQVKSVVDTTGAGDAFVGSLAAELARGADLRSATELGVLAGSYSVELFGAQSSYPTRDSLLIRSK